MSFRSGALVLLGRIPVLSGILRWFARRYAEGSIVHIRSGRAEGFRWRRHHRYVNGYWLGHYEMPLQNEIHRALKPGQTFFDVGGNAGFFTLLGASAVGPGGRCVSFEPLPENAASIREQLDLNGFTNCNIFEGAVTIQPGLVQITRGSEGDSEAHIAEASTGDRLIQVPAITLDLAAERFGVPDVVKMDIEGFEGSALRGEGNLLRAAKTRWIIEIHSQEAWEDVRSQLETGHDLLDLAGVPVQGISTFPHHVVAIPIARRPKK